MYVVVVQFEIKPTHADAFHRKMLVQASMSLTQEPHCRQFDICVDPSDATKCFLYEKYDDRAAFDEHLASNHFSRFNATTSPWIRNKTVLSWELAN